MKSLLPPIQFILTCLLLLAFTSNFSSLAQSGVPGGVNVAMTITTERCVGETITFTDNSTGGSGLSYSWNFGTSASPSSATGPGPHGVVYSIVGPKTISLTVTELFGSSTGSETITINDQCVSIPTAPIGCQLSAVGPITETVIGSTTYDLQSNSSVQDRIIQFPNGDISVVWTWSEQLNQTFADRGTGYVHFDGTNWSLPPTSRLESSRCGWPTIISTSSGSEMVIAHNTAFSYMQSVSRDTVGVGNWNEQIVSPQDSFSGNHRYLSWNRTAVGGPTGHTVHMIALTAPVANGGSIYNGLDGALLYYRSLDGGQTWDIQDAQLPTMDQFNFLGFQADAYAIHARENTVAIAVFGEWYDSFIMKSTNNGLTWTRTTFLDFPIDQYQEGNGFNLDGNGTWDDVYTTDASGAVLVDHSGTVHVVAGNMLHLDEGVGSVSWFPLTNGLLYWNETMGPDTAMTTSLNDAWWSNNMRVIAGASDLDGDSIVSGIDASTSNWATYFNSSLSSFPSMGIDGDDNLYVSFSAYTETVSSPIGNQVYRHLNLIKSSDDGISWTCPVDITPHSASNGQKECVFGSMVKEVDDRVRIVYQRDDEPGLTVRGDIDPVGMNEIVYIEIDTGLNSYGCLDSLACNYDPNATISNGNCFYASPIDAGPDRLICSGDTVHLSVSGGQTYLWSPSTGLNNPFIANPIASPITSTTYVVAVSSGGCVAYDTVEVNLFLVADTLMISACSSYTHPVFPITWNTSGIYPVQQTNSEGCDSVTVFDLTIYTEVSPAVYVNGSLISTDSYASYQWLFNGLPISGANGQSYIVPVDGFYSVSVTDSEDCSGESQLVFVTAGGPQPCDPPDSTWSTDITDSSATMNWSAAPTAIGYQVFWREIGTIPWNIHTLNSAVDSVSIDNLAQLTSYEWQVLSICSTDSSSFTPLDTFATTGGPECDVSYTWTNSSGNDFNYNVSSFLQSGTVTVFLWDYGDGNQSAEFLTIGSYSYASAGTYIACVQLVTSTSCLATYCDTITVGSLPTCLGTDSVYTTTTNITTSSATLAWTSVAGVDHFLIRGGLAGSSNPVELTINNGAATTKNVAGLNPSTSYQWQIKAYCDSAETLESDWSSLAIFTTATPPPCFVPTGLNTGPVTSNSARLNWTPAIGANSYTIQGRAAPGPGWPVSLTVNGGTTAHKDVFGLNPNKTYDWRIRSNCGNGNNSPYSGHISFTTNSGARYGNDNWDPIQSGVISVAPNPFKHSTILSFPNPDFEEFQIRLIDINGKVLRRYESVKKSFLEIEKAELPSGIYYVEARSSKLSFGTRIVIE